MPSGSEGSPVGSELLSPSRARHVQADGTHRRAHGFWFSRRENLLVTELHSFTKCVGSCLMSSLADRCGQGTRKAGDP